MSTTKKSTNTLDRRIRRAPAMVKTLFWVGIIALVGEYILGSELRFLPWTKIRPIAIVLSILMALCAVNGCGPIGLVEKLVAWFGKRAETRREDEDEEEENAEEETPPVRHRRAAAKPAASAENAQPLQVTGELIAQLEKQGIALEQLLAMLESGVPLESIVAGAGNGLSADQIKLFHEKGYVVR